MNELQRQIVNKIKENRISTTEILDVLDKNYDYYMDVKPLNPGKFVVGMAHIVDIIDESNWWIHLDLIDVDKDSIVVVRSHGEKRAAFGSLVCKYLFLYKQIQAVVSDGNLRDGHTLIKEDYPIWLNDLSSVGCFNKFSEEGQKTYEEYKKWIEDSIIIADDSGVGIIPLSLQTEAILKKLDFIEWQEDKWFECIDSGWDTYDTVCLKKYLGEQDGINVSNESKPKRKHNS